MAGTEPVENSAVCGACGQIIRTLEGEARLRGDVPHACKSCRCDLHSYLHCSAVWMPTVDKYFCSLACIKQHNTLRLKERNAALEPLNRLHPGAGVEWELFCVEGDVFALEQLPDNEAQVDASCFDLEGVDASCNTPDGAEDDGGVDGSFEEEEGQDAEDSDSSQEKDVQDSVEHEDEEDDHKKPKPAEPQKDEDDHVSDEVLELTKDGLRVQICYKACG